MLEGEPLTVHCVAEEPAKFCQWKRKALYDTDPLEKNSWTTEESFASSGMGNRDCSLQFKYARIEHQGMWVCSIKFQDDEPFLDAMPSAVTIKSPSKCTQLLNYIQLNRLNKINYGYLLRLMYWLYYGAIDYVHILDILQWCILFIYFIDTTKLTKFLH